MSKQNSKQIIAQNRKARYNYTIQSTMEAGIVLVGTEVKSLRTGKCFIQESYATEQSDGFYLVNAQIQEYKSGNRFNHEPKRPRKLLLKKREMKKLHGAIREKGMTLVPLSIYFNEKGLAKVELGLAQGKRQYDKRETEKQRDWQRQKARLLR